MKQKTTYHVLIHNGREIPYEWIRKKVKNLNLRVRADGTVFVSSPHGMTKKEMEAFLTEKANFLFRALDAVQARNAEKTPPRFRDGDTVFLFGEPKTLRFSPLFGKNIVEKDGFLLLSSETDEKAIQKKLRNYAQQQLLALLFSLSEKALLCFPQVLRSPKIRLRAMRATWGNCRAKEGILTFNSRLACYPVSCIEYVVMHEFSHFLVPNHSAAFYTVLSKGMPDWKERKTRLNSCPIQPFF